MAWSTPLTAVTNAILTVAQWNASVRDNLNTTPASMATAPTTDNARHYVSTGANTIAERLITVNTIATSQTLGTSGSYLDLATVGPTVVITTGIQALVMLSASIANSGANDNYVSFAVSVGTTVAASDTRAIRTRGASSASILHRTSVCSLISALNSGSNTFTAKYKVSAITGTFVDRQMIVMGL